MSANSIHVTPNTTDVEISILESPYSQVLLDTIQYDGQTVSVVAATSSPSILETPILVSTASNQYFNDGTISTLINQPLGYLTLQSRSPSTFVFLNSFPFRNEYISAGVYSLLTSTLNTQQISTIEYYTSQLNVENLVITKNFFQSAGISLTTNVSTLGNVILQSTLTVYGNTYFSSFFSTIGSIDIYSSLSIRGNLFVDAPIENRSTLVAYSIRSLSSVSTNNLQIQGSFLSKDIFIESQNIDSIDIFGGAVIQGLLSTPSSLYVSTIFKTSSLQVFGSSIISSLSIVGSLTNRDFMSIAGTASTQGNVNIRGNTLFNSSFQIGGNGEIFENIVVNGNIIVEKKFSTNTLQVDNFNVTKEFKQFLSEFHIQKGGILEENLTSKNLESLSTFIGGNASINKDAQFDSLFVKDNVHVSIPAGFLTVLSSLQVGGTIQVENNLISDKNIESKAISLDGGLTAVSSITSFSSFFLNNLTVKNLYTQNFYTQNIDLALNLVGNSFFVNNANMGNKTITENLNAEYAYTSSFQGGAQQVGSTLFSLEGTLHTNILSSFNLSSLVLFLSTQQGESTFTRFVESLAIGESNISQTFIGSGIAYTTNDIRVGKIVSTSALIGDEIIGANFQGNGENLRNVAFPNTVQIQTIQASTLYTDTTFASTVYASSAFVYEQLNTLSTVKIGTVDIYGAGNSLLSLSTNSIYSLEENNKTLILGNMFINNLASQGLRDSVMINGFSNIGSSISSYIDGYKFYVYNGSLRIKELISPNFLFFGDTLALDSFFISTFFIQERLIVPGVSTNFGTLFVSSGTIGSGNGTFFISENLRYQQLSTNTIQPIQSTLIFNSTLYISPNKVGIGAFPNYPLDVPTTGNITSTLTVLNTTLVNEVKHFKTLSSTWFAASGTYCNIVQSSNNGYSFTDANINLAGITGFTRAFYQGSNAILFAGSYRNPGLSYVDNTNTLIPVDNEALLDMRIQEVIWNGSIFLAAGTPQFYSEGSIFYSFNGLTWYSTSNSFYQYANCIAWNGSMWVAGGNDNDYYGSGNNPLGYIKYSYNGKEWFDSATGGFIPSDLINYWYQGGANGIVWTKNGWVATGRSPDANSRSTIMRSTDGISWYYEDIRGISGTGYDIEYNGKIMVIVGDYNFSSNTNPIFYSLDLGKTWSPANLGNTVFYYMRYVKSTDDNWIAISQEGGYYNSLNGIDWQYNNSGNVVGAGYTSNQTSFINLQKPGISTNILFVENHQYGTQYLFSTNTFGFNPSSLNFNYTLFLDQRQNTTIGTAPGYFNNYNSTFFVDGTASISSFVSSPTMKVGAYFLGMQTV